MNQQHQFQQITQLTEKCALLDRRNKQLTDELDEAKSVIARATKHISDNKQLLDTIGKLELALEKEKHRVRDALASDLAYKKLQRVIAKKDRQLSIAKA